MDPTGTSPVDEVVSLAEAARALFRRGRVTEGLSRLGRSVWLLGGSATDAPGRVPAVLAAAAAAHAAELYETAADLLAGLPATQPEVVDLHTAVLLEWGLRLDHLGRRSDAERRWSAGLVLLAGRQPAADAHPCPAAVQSLLLAGLGRAGEALALVDASSPSSDRESGLTALAAGIASRQLGDLPRARRELERAEQLWDGGGRPAERIVLQQELTRLALQEHPDADPVGTLRRALRVHAELLWAHRLQRLATLRQAHTREQLDADRSLVDQALLQDPLTALGNRRRFDQRLASVAEAGAVTQSLVLLDVDDFKAVNDTHSHPVGDQVLRDVAGVLRANSRADDVAVRLGGDEFALFLEAAAVEAVEIAERVRREVEAIDWDLLGHGLRVTVSGGVATQETGQGGTDLFAAADEKLYEAKRSGRNRIAS